MNIEPSATTTRLQLERMDETDPLAPVRERFHVPRALNSAPDAPPLVYLDGNSLGVVPRGVSERVRACIEDEWGGDLVSSWNSAGWVNLPRTVAAKIAPLIGAEANDVRVADSTSVNLFKVLAAALALRPDRTRIVSQRRNFPTDLYMVEGLNGLTGGERRLDLVDASDDPEAAIEAMLGVDTAVLLLTEIDYRTGRRLDMARLTKAAHVRGALVVWDLAHSAGAVPVRLAECDADFAVGCGYKYLNGGPGAPAFLYVAAKHQSEARNPLSGWFAHAAPFAFESGFRPAEGADRFLAGTPPVLSMVALDAALDAWDGVSIETVREKSVALTDLFIALVERANTDLRLVTPRDPARRGSQVSFAHEHAYPIVKCLIARGVVGDFRAGQDDEPGIARFGFTPLYTRYADVWDAAERIGEVMETRAWDAPEFHERSAVT